MAKKQKEQQQEKEVIRIKEDGLPDLTPMLQEAKLRRILGMNEEIE